MSDKIPPQSRESIIKGLCEHFGVKQAIVRAILDSKNWDLEKCIRLVEAVSPKASKDKSATKGPNDNKAAPANKGKESNKNKKNNSEDGKASASSASGNSKMTPKNKNKQKVQIVKENLKIGGKDSEPWAVVEFDKKTGPLKNKQKNSKATSTSVPSTSNSASPQETPLFKSAPNNVKKEKRAVLKSAYEIIKQKQNEVDRIRDCIKCGIRIIVLMRGCPGSGKSTYAQQILLKNGIKNPENHIFSTDNYFMDSKGSYNYNKANLDQAHKWNQTLVEKVMKLGFSPIIIDNTHVKSWEMDAYSQFSVRQGYVLETLQPPTPWFFNDSILAKKNTHGVPKCKITSMLEQYEPNLTGADLLKKLNIDYTIQQSPPQAATYSLEQVLAVINKAMLGKRPPDSVKTTPVQTKSKKTDSNSLSSDPYSDIEVVQYIPLYHRNNESSVTTQTNASVDGTVIREIRSYPTLPSSSQANENFPANNKNFSNKMDSRNYPFKSQLAQAKFSPDAGTHAEMFSRQPQPYQVSNQNIFHNNAFNLIDKPLDEGLDGSLINPLLPQSSTVQMEKVTSNDKLLDQSEFPSLASSNSSHKSKINSDASDMKIFEEKIEQLIELFPDLNKDCIKDLCADPNANLDHIVTSLLDLNKNSDSSQGTGHNYTVSNDEICGNVEDINSNSTSDDEEDENESGQADAEKDMNMLIQVFPNLTEYKIREVYKKYGQDFRVTLEELLREEPSESGTTSKDLPCSSMPDQVSSVSQSGGMFSKLEDPDINKHRVPDVSSSDLEGKVNVFKNIVLYENADSASGESKSEGISPFLSNKNSSDIQDNLAKDIKIPELFKSFGLESRVDLDPLSKNIYNSDLKPDIVNPGLEQEAKVENTSGKLSNIFTLDKFEITMNNVLSYLGQKSQESKSAEIISGSDNMVTEPIEGHSSLMAKLLDWNFSGSTTCNLNESVDCDPKDQRERFNSLHSGLCNNATNTNYKDFELLKQAQYSNKISEKVINGTQNFVSCIEPVDKCYIPKDRLTLDKGTITDVEKEFVNSDNDTGSLLTSMFPNIPLSDLESLLKSCVGDLNWTVSLLLDSGHEISPNFNPSEYNVKIKDILNTQSAGDTGISPDSTDIDNPIQSAAETSHSAKVKKRNGRTPVPVEQLNFVMNDESMSDRLRKIRNARLGIADCTDVSTEDCNCPSTFEFDDSNINTSSEEDDREEETLGVALSTDFILALQAQFGGFIPSIVPDNQVLVNLPVGLARQLHLCIIDSLSQQIEEEDRLMNKMIEEDECLARQLQDIENGITEKHQSIQEIMDEELSLNIHRSLNKGKSNENTMAGKLARQLLIERFPSMDPLALKAILDDTDYSLDQATHLLEAAGYDPRLPEEITTFSDQIDENPISREEAVEQANAYREAAKVFYQMRHDCFLKAQKAYSEGKKHVASYYSQMANWHNQKLEQANLLASTMLMTGNESATTLDLHFLRVCEAMQVLDLFIDAHVRNLIEMKVRKRQVYLITGRGLHSHDGKSKIRPATIAKLKQRFVEFKIVNPGLLMAFITSKTPLTYQKQ